MRKSKKIDLTEGDIFIQLVMFVWPIILSNVFQQIYNITNSMIVGNYMNTAALSAVSASHTISTLTSYFFYGISTACGILVSNFYGAGEKKNVKTVIETGLFVSFVMGLGLTLIFELLIPQLMHMTNVSPELFADAEVYLRMYMIGNVPMFLYNVMFFIMRSMGDSRHPLYYLMVSCGLNILLGIIFVKYLGMGVAGTALATVLSQLLVDILAWRALARLDEEIRVDLRHLHPDGAIAKRMLELGIPAAVQNMLIAFSTLVVQAYINLFPNEVIAGLGVATKVAAWVQIPMQSISTIGTNFVGQNLGAKKYDRLQKGIVMCNVIASGITLVCAVFVFIFADFFVAMFARDPEVIRYGAIMTRFTVFSYVPLTWSHIYNGCCRGAGNVKIPMIIAVMSQCVFKYIFVTVGLKIRFSIYIIYLSTALSFTLAGIFATLYFYTSKWTKEAHLRP